MDSEPEIESQVSQPMGEEPMPPIPSIAEVERITIIEDAVIRNLQITQCYHELAGD